MDKDNYNVARRLLELDVKEAVKVNLESIIPTWKTRLLTKDLGSQQIQWTFGTTINDLKRRSMVDSIDVF